MSRVNPYLLPFLFAELGFVANFFVWLFYTQRMVGALVALACFVVTGILYSRTQ